MRTAGSPGPESGTGHREGDMSELYKNAKFYSMNAENAVCSAMLVTNGRIVCMGSLEELKAAAGEDCTESDLDGQSVLPGFIDSHMHLLEYGITRERVFLGNAKSLSELLAILKEALRERRLSERAEAGSETPWLVGYGFNQDYFRTESGAAAGLPTRQDLDQVSRTVPIFITRACFHVSSCNTKALELTGLLGEGDVRIDGGSLDYGEDGLANGIARENAVDLFYEALPPIRVPEAKAALKSAMKELAKYGITTVHSDDFTAAENYADVMQAYEELSAEGSMTVRVYEQCRLRGIGELAEFIGSGAYHSPKERDPEAYFTPGSVKIIEDGSLGARTAWMRKDYSDGPGTRGMLLLQEDELYEYMKTAHHAGMQIETHAIGDGTIELLLNLYERLQNEEPKPLRHGIVHCQITDGELLSRFGRQDILAYIQPIFLHYDLHVVESRVGTELASTSYAWKTLLESGVHVSGGSDCPVEFFNVMEGIYCAVTRKDLNGEPAGGWHPEQCLDVEEAVRIYTEGGAYAGFEEAVKGRLEPGMLADFAVLSEDIFTCEPDRIKDIRVERTVVGGKTVWDRQRDS